MDYTKNAYLNCVYCDDECHQSHDTSDDNGNGDCTAEEGEAKDGGGRSVTLATEIVHDKQGVESLGGGYGFQLSDADPDAEGEPTIQSASRPVNVAFTRFEFEG